jgi:hypothetical protein
MQLLTRSISVYLGALPRIDLAPQDGIEPPTFWLTARRNYRCATEEYNLAILRGIEPRYPTRQAGIITTI